LYELAATILDTQN